MRKWIEVQKLLWKTGVEAIAVHRHTTKAVQKL